MKQLSIGKLEFPYKINWSKKRKTISIGVNPKLEIIVKAPEETSLNQIEKSLNKKKPWILKKVKNFKKQEIPPLDKEFMSGEKLLYKGRRYRLKVNEDKNSNFKFDKGKFLLELPELKDQGKRRAEAERMVKKWYVEMAEDQFILKTKNWSKNIGGNLEEVAIKDYKKNWGKTKENKIYYNWRAILLPVSVQNYLIAHEVAHLRASKHNNRFWNVVGTMVPNYEEKKEYLKEKGNLFKI